MNSVMLNACHDSVALPKKIKNDKKWNVISAFPPNIADGCKFQQVAVQDNVIIAISFVLFFLHFRLT